jgi:2-dehydro-3-deoxygluconokinase
MPEIVALGEGMVEFAAADRGPLHRVAIFRRGIGGDTSNFLIAAARSGARCGYVTRVGDDEFGRLLLSIWTQEGIDTSRVIVDPDGYTAAYFISFDEEGRHAFTYYRRGSAASRLQPADVDPTYLDGARVFHTSGISQAISSSANASVLHAVREARSRGVLVSFDVNVRPKLQPIAWWRDEVDSILPLVDLMFVSAEDTSHLFGARSPEDVAELLLARGPRLAVVKLGLDGCLLASSEAGCVRMPAWTVDTIDGTGAGDAFAGAFVAAWLGGAGPADAGQVASAAGALATTELGAVTATPRRDEIEAFLSARRSLTGAERGREG